MVHQLNVYSKSFLTKNTHKGNWFGARLKIIFHTNCTRGQLIYLYASSAHRFSISYLFPHKMHRSRRVGSTCRSFIQEIAPKVWFWFAKILKRSGSFLGKVFHHYRHVFYRFDRNVIKPSGRAWFRCSVRGCSAKWGNYNKNITNIPICSISG